MAIDLSNARRKVESFMTDSCTVLSPTAHEDAEIDPDTLELIYPDSATLYDGPCKFKDETSAARQSGGRPGDDEGGVALLIVVSSIDFPIDDVPETGLPEGCLIMCTGSLRMPQLVGAEFVMRRSILKTFAVQYTVLADRRRAVDP